MEGLRSSFSNMIGFSNLIEREEDESNIAHASRLKGVMQMNDVCDKRVELFKKGVVAIFLALVIAYYAIMFGTKKVRQRRRRKQSQRKG